MQSILPFVDSIGDGSSLERLCQAVLSLKETCAA
jgi:hypothetical protein